MLLSSTICSLLLLVVGLHTAPESRQGRTQLASCYDWGAHAMWYSCYDNGFEG